MAETSERPTAVPAPPPDPEALEYRPVSGWAVASLLVTGIYVVVVLVGGGVALYTWSPYLLPLWSLALPVAGLVLALAAQWHIRRSEGTRAGAGLARASWWTCLLLVLIYLSFYASTFMAVRQQADNRVREWFELLRAGKVNEAFLKTQPPEQRQNVSPDPKDEHLLRARFDSGQPGQRGALTIFRSSELTRLIQQGGQESQIEGHGVQDWQFSEGVYSITRLYHITTPEGEIEVTITARGAENKARPADGRQWYLPWEQASITRGRPTAFGELIQDLRTQGFLFLDEWKKKIATGTVESLESAYLDIHPAAERAAKQAAYRAGKIDVKGFVNSEQLRADDEAARKATVEAVENLFRQRGDEELRVLSLDVTFAGDRRWEQVQGRLRFAFAGNLLLGVGTAPKYRCSLILVAESAPGAAESGKAESWRVLRLDIITAVDPLRKENMLLSQ